MEENLGFVCEVISHGFGSSLAGFFIIIEMVFHKAGEDCHLRRDASPTKTLQLPAIELHHT